MARERIQQLEHDIELKLEGPEVGKLLTSIDGIGAQIGSSRNSATPRFRNASALASCVGVIPPVRQSNKRR
jgi:hypothetical protein